MAYSRDQILEQNKDYSNYSPRWEYYIRSFLGGQEYKDGKYLQEYQLELENEYYRRIQNTPVDNHCRNIVNIYSSFLFRIKPVRELGGLEDDKTVPMFLDDADLEGRSYTALLRELQTYASVYGNCWAILDKPNSNAKTRAEELNQEIRPYINIVTPENVIDWNYSRASSGKYYLDYLKVRENIGTEETTYRIWYTDRIDTVVMKTKGTNDPKLIESIPNNLGVIPAVVLYNQRSPMRAIGISDLTDIADLQRSIYNELSEIEQLIRLANHPSLVKTRDVDASAGAGAIIEMTDNLDPALADSYSKEIQFAAAQAKVSEYFEKNPSEESATDAATYLAGGKATDNLKPDQIALLNDARTHAFQSGREGEVRTHFNTNATRATKRRNLAAERAKKYANLKRIEQGQGDPTSQADRELVEKALELQLPQGVLLSSILDELATVLSAG